MELKEVAAKIKEILQLDNISDLPKRLMKSILSDNADEVYEKYMLSIGIEKDFMQKTYQFWLADRGKGSLQQDYTPSSIAELAAKITKCPVGGTVYDCCAGSGALTIAMHRQDSTLRFVCEELDENVIPLLLFNLAIRRIEAVVIRGDVLKDEIYEAFAVKPQGKYSIVERMAEYTLEKYDACISNPPYNIPYEPPQDGLFVPEKYSEYGIPPKNNANFAFVLHCLQHIKENGIATLILPNGILSANGMERNIREKLVCAGKIYSVVTMPDSMFESTGIGTCLFILKKDGDGTLAMIDARQAFHEEIRNQRGEGDKSHTNRVYHKKMKVFSSEDIQRIDCAVKQRENHAEFSQVVTVDEIAKQDYILSPSRYIKLGERQVEHRPYQEILRDINKIAKERNAVKITMNQTLARETGWEEISNLLEQGKKITESMNTGIIKLLNLPPIEDENYLTLSKRAGEIKIENTSKESVSGIFAIIMPMLRQHIFYLNDCENKLLAEFRDAVLPDLMSGKIDVSELSM